MTTAIQLFGFTGRAFPLQLENRDVLHSLKKKVSIANLLNSKEKKKNTVICNNNKNDNDTNTNNE